jgi:hypothetical protein
MRLRVEPFEAMQYIATPRYVDGVNIGDSNIEEIREWVELVEGARVLSTFDRCRTVRETESVSPYPPFKRACICELLTPIDGVAGPEVTLRVLSGEWLTVHAGYWRCMTNEDLATCDRDAPSSRPKHSNY